MEQNEDGSYSIKGQLWRLPPNYKLHSVLGSGAYGCVCRCTNLEDQEEVAVKRIEDVFISKTDALRILREISILRRLKHKNIVRLFNVLNPTEPPHPLRTLYVFFEYAGMDLHKFAHSDRCLEIEEVQKIMVQLCEGLKFMHRSCVIHRDIKPANILLDPATMVVKIADFGLSRVLDEETAGTVRKDMDEDSSSEDELGGAEEVHSSAAPSFVPPKMQRAMSEHVVTRWYRAPEVILCRGHYAQSIDIWSVGCIFAELLNLLSSAREKSQRRPLFPGRSCFPLSPSSNTCFKDMTDQLNVIFGIIGTPTHEEVLELDAGPDVRSYLTQLGAKDPVDLAARFPHAPEQAVSLLQGLITFSASKRTTMETALASPFLKDAAERERGASKTRPARLRPGESDSVTKADLARLGEGAAAGVEAGEGGGDGGEDGLDEAGEGADEDDASPPVLIRSLSMLTAKQLLRLQFESKYDRRNHTEAVQKLSALFRSEIDALHETSPLEGGGK